ncbi:hypothetical protein ACHAP8_003713 [Fusarium lateritium]
MSSRHVPIKRLQSGVLFSAPDVTQRFPPDEARVRPQKRNIIRTRAPDVRGIEAIDSVGSGGSPIPEFKGSLSMFATYSGHPEYRSSPKPSPWMRFLPPKEEKATLCLPVLKVSSTTMIEGTLAHTTIIQSFHNPSQMTISEARHTFPLYDGAVVTEFECTIGDERRLRGVVKSREQAHKEYKKAVQEQAKAAALLEEHTPEVFETSIGNIPPMTTVEIMMVHIQELKVVMMEGEATEGVAFIVPTSIAPRYSKSPPASEITRDGLDIKIRVLNDGKVNADGCQEESGHEVYYDGPRVMESPIFDGNKEQPLREYYCWDHHSDGATLRKDFVFVIQMQKGCEMQSQAVLCPPDDAGLAAMMVSIRPSNLFSNAIVPQSFSGEIIFLLDQSGSMNERVGDYGRPRDGSPFFFQDARCPRKIDVLREAMLLVIAGLPKTCSFNIVSWGSETWAMWEQSRKHSPDNIKEAKEYVSQTEANLGGTDLLRALESSIQRRRDDITSTQIVVLTDGELDPNEPMEFVWKTRQALQNKIRFFALGIGSNVPHSLIESISDLGGGFGDIIDTAQNPRWHSRLNRLFKSSLEPDSWDCDISIGHEFERHSLIDFRLNKDTPDTQRVPYFQAPHTITDLHPFKFTSIFFLINVRDYGALPSEITITTTTNGAKKKTYRLPVKQTIVRDGIMHRLAAKAALVDLEDLVKQESSNSLIVEENAETIGTRYSIASKWTSFVAVPQDELTTTTEGSMMDHYKAMYDDIDFDELLMAADLNSDNDTDAEDYAPRLEADMFQPRARRRSPSPPVDAILPGPVVYVRPNSISRNMARRPTIVDERVSRKSEHLGPSIYDIEPSRRVSRASSREVKTRSEKERAASLDADVQTNRRTLSRRTTRNARLHRSSNEYVESSSSSGSSDLQNARPATALSYRLRSYHRVREREVRSDRRAREREVRGVARNERIVYASDTPNPAMDRRASPRTAFQHIIHNELVQNGDSLSERAKSPSPGTIDPLNWEVAVEYQNGQGLFELPESARGLLHLHFCPDTVLETVEKLDLLLSNQPRYQGSSDAVVVDTVMTILCYETHLALEEDLWDLMMERARDAVTEAIGQETMEIMEEFLTASMMHKHYTTVEGVNRYGDRESTGEARCPVCRIRWQFSRTFSCHSERGPLMPHVFLDWEAFWRHQKESGHMACPRE